MGLHIWKVSYHKSFSSSSTDDGPYIVQHPDCEGYILTVGDSLADVEKAIKSTLSNQEQFQKLNGAEFLGISINGLAVEEV